MIRLGELECAAGTALVKVEGNLTPDTLLVLGQTLADYQQRGIGAVNLAADGVVSIDRLALEAWLRENPPQPELRVLTARVVLHQLLASCGVKVVFAITPT
jgi:hypothetical protein